MSVAEVLDEVALSLQLALEAETAAMGRDADAGAAAGEPDRLASDDGRSGEPAESSPLRLPYKYVLSTVHVWLLRRPHPHGGPR